MHFIQYSMSYYQVSPLRGYQDPQRYWAAKCFICSPLTHKKKSHVSNKQVNKIISRLQVQQANKGGRECSVPLFKQATQFCTGPQDKQCFSSTAGMEPNELAKDGQVALAVFSQITHLQEIPCTHFMPSQLSNRKMPSCVICTKMSGEG